MSCVQETGNRVELKLENWDIETMTNLEEGETAENLEQSGENWVSEATAERWEVERL